MNTSKFAPKILHLIYAIPIPMINKNIIRMIDIESLSLNINNSKVIKTIKMLVARVIKENIIPIGIVNPISLLREDIRKQTNANR
jgi:hypothetical protein